MEEKKQIISILFADIKGFSEIKNDKLYSILNSQINNLLDVILTKQNCFFKNTWGDAFFICSHDPIDLVEIAFSLRDFFRNTNWIAKGFPKMLTIRIAVHTEKVIVKYEKGEIKNVIGTNVNSAARIEPMVSPNDIWASNIFRQLAIDEVSNFEFVDLGIRDLAKEYGKMHLFKVIRDYEQKESNETNTEHIKEINIPIPKIKKKATDKEKMDFVKKSFLVISNYFEQALREIEKKDKEIESEYTKKSQYDIEANIYIHGNNKAHCKLFLDQDFSGAIKSIKFAHGRYITDNSANEIIQVEDDGYNLLLRPIGMLFSHKTPDQTKDAVEIAEYLWIAFTNIISQ